MFRYLLAIFAFLATPVAAQEIVASNGDTLVRTERATIGINKLGVFNSYEVLPVGWPRTTYYGEGQRASAGLAVDGVEYVQQDAAIVGTLVKYGATTYAQQGAGYNYTPLVGVNDGLVWSGGDAKLRVQQTTRIEGGRVYLTVKLTNTGASTITRYDWFANLAPTTALPKMSVTKTSVVSAGLSVMSTDPRAIYYITPVLWPRATTVLPTKTTVSAAKSLDRSAAVGFLLNIKPGESDTISWSVGIK